MGYYVIQFLQRGTYTLSKNNTNTNLSDPNGAGPVPTSTVGRGRSISPIDNIECSSYNYESLDVKLANSLDLYSSWDSPTAIISDGAYGILGFEGDTSDHIGLTDWYEPHIAAWATRATPETTLWFWNSEIGWAVVHPILEKHGWRYINANIWNKGKSHIAGNVNTKKIRRFPVVSEMCVQYVFEATVCGLPLKKWLRNEWKRTGLPFYRANEACGVKDAAVRKYFDQGHLWYFPPPEMFIKIQEYANKYGHDEGKPYFSIDSVNPASATEWKKMRAKFRCPHGFTNVWDRPALRGSERYKLNGTNGKAIHLNQKPLDLTTMIIKSCTDPGDVVWEPFGGLFTACIASQTIGRKSFGAELDQTYFHYALKRIKKDLNLESHFQNLNR